MSNHRWIRSLSPSIFVALMGVLMTPLLYSQINTGTIVGVVTDPQGSVIPGATVIITHVELRSATEVITNDQGFYHASALRAGPYEVRVQLTGFRTAVRSGIQVSVQDRVEVNFKLELGQISDVVQVEGGAPVLQTSSAQLGSVIENRLMEDLPLDGRRYSDLILLSPGALPAAPDRGNPREARINVGGAGDLQNYFSLGGVDNNSFTQNVQERSPQVIQPPPDALKEFRIQTRTYDAEFGWSMGAVINAELKSGANDFHGSGWWFHRNDALNANNFFLNKANIAKADETRNQQGATIGGPIFRDRTFFFFDYQNTHRNAGTTVAGTVPTLRMKQGIFTGDRDLVIARDSGGRPYYPAIVPCVDEVNDRLNLNALRTDGRPCGDPVGLKLVQLYPDPNSGKFGYVSAPTIPLRQHSFDARLDHILGRKDAIYGSYSFYQVRTVVERGPFPNPLATGGFTANSYVRGQLAAATWNHTFGPNLLNSLQGGLNRIYSISEPFAPSGDRGPEFGLTGLPGAFAAGLPPIRVAGYSFLGSSEWRPQYTVSQIYQVLENLSYIRGNHSMKFGFEFKRAINNFLDIKAPNGRILLDSSWVNDSVANLLLGNIQRVEATTALVPHNYTDGIMFYVQDAWKAHPRLTLNYGVRYEFFTPVIERARKVSNFDPTANGGRGAIITNTPGPLPSVPCSFDCLKRGPEGDSLFARTLVHPDRNNFAPRFGFAYRATERMVLRGGYAVFFQVADRIGSSAILQLNGPQLVDFRGFEARFNEPSRALLRDGFPRVDLSNFNPLAVEIRGRDMNERTPYSQQWSFGPQFRVGKDISLDLAYVGSGARKARRLGSLNQGIIRGPGNIVFPFPDWGPIADFLESDGTRNFHSFQVQARKAFSQGYALNLAYTWSKTLGNFIENLSGGGGTAQQRPQNIRDKRAEYGRLNFDQNHRIVVNWVWELPFGVGKAYASQGALGHIVGGWQFNGIWSSTSGSPITVSARDVSGTFSPNARADCIGNPVSNGLKQTVDAFFDRRAFRQPLPFTFGSCGTAVLSSWAQHNFDLSLFRNFNFTENRRLQFRAEFFNAFNTPQFSSPNRDVNSPRFGQTERTSVFDREGRVIQLGLKFQF